MKHKKDTFTEGTYIIIITVLVMIFISILIKLMPMSNSETGAIMTERGGYMYNKDIVYIYMPEEPLEIELEAVTILASNADVIVLSLIQE